MRKLVTSGESVKASSVTRLIAELNSLRSQLQIASGSMTAAQRRRFQKIKDSYEPAGQAVTARTRIRAKVYQAPSAPLVTSEPAPAPRTVPEVPALAGISCTASLSEDVLFTPARRGQTKVPEAVVDYNRFAILAIADWGVRPAFGFLGLYRWSGKTGVYTSFRSNFIGSDASYSVSSSGAINGGGVFWGNSVERYSRWNVTAGLDVNVGKNGLWSIFGGAGYGAHHLTWQDDAGNWATVSDYSYEGPAAEAGVMLHYRSLCLMAGACWCGRLSFTTGLGLSF
ncbi:MAG: hypothetical protein J6O51_06500 [Bacteroidales bacterium]|nr:hypothetical protein [Bacteroidales bacterium]